jgi:hypothetical protein
VTSVFFLGGSVILDHAQWNINKTLENTERGNEENGQSRETSNVGYNNMKYNTENEQDDQHGLHKKNNSDPGFRERLTILNSVNIEHKSYKIRIRSFPPICLLYNCFVGTGNW